MGRADVTPVRTHVQLTAPRQSPHLARWAGLDVAADAHGARASGLNDVGDARELVLKAALAEMVACGQWGHQ